jgi:hypothetical protein
LVLSLLNVRATLANPLEDHDLVQLAAWLTGSFSSAEQSQADPEYFDIRLEMHRIWHDRTDGFWLYVEQARADALERPYRQRVYRLFRREDGDLESAVYELPGDPLQYVGAWKDRRPLAGLNPNDLVPKTGCSIVMRREGARFVGGTVGKGCASTRQGAAYTTSEITLEEGLLVSWDRGFDEKDQQVWGATRGGYRFHRIKSHP